MFFCEVAAAMDILFDGLGGWPIEQDWWRRGPHDYGEHLRRYCYRCSCALPLPPCDNTGPDVISRGNFEALRALGSPKILNGSPVRIVDQVFSRQEIERYARKWRPWDYLGEDGARTSRSLCGAIHRYRTE